MFIKLKSDSISIKLEYINATTLTKTSLHVQLQKCNIKFTLHISSYYVVFDSIGECGVLPSPTNGQVSHPNGRTIGQTATYTCNTGYNLEGDSTRMCQATGMWSRSEPTCTRMFWHLVLKNNSLFYYAKNFISSL